MDTSKSSELIQRMMGESPRAYANIRGSEKYPDLRGMVLFYRANKGTLVFAEFINLPVGEGNCGQRFFGFHIHEGSACTGNAEDAFADTGAHLNPHDCEHPQHMGDMPAVMAGADGYAWMVFFTDKFSAEDVKGRTVAVHEKPDDFMTQPSGNSGEKIGCGEIF